MRRMVIDLLNLERGKAYGFQEYVFNLLNYFFLHRNEINYDSIIIWCKKTEKEMFSQYEGKFQIDDFDYSSYLKKHWIQSILPIRYKLNNLDLIWSPGNISGVIKCCPEILTIHDLLYKRKLWVPSRLMRWQREILIPISIKKANRIIAISEFTKADIAHFYPEGKNKIEVIYNSFNFNKYEGDCSSDVVGKYFLAISSNFDYKNQKTIIKAFEMYKQNGGDNLLVMVGSMNGNSDASKVYRNLPNNIKSEIIWKSNISNKDLGALYRGASCFISASMFEGLGMPVVEAMSFGLPVLLSDIPPHREVSLNKGEYFDPTDIKELSKKMLAINFDKRNYDKDIKKFFSEENTSAKYIDLINHIYVQTC